MSELKFVPYIFFLPFFFFSECVCPKSVLLQFVLKLRMHWVHVSSVMYLYELQVSFSKKKKALSYPWVTAKIF